MGLFSCQWSLISSPVRANESAGRLVPRASSASRTRVSREPAPTFPEGWGPLSVVGESQYQPALRRVSLDIGRICWATLALEPDNPFDGNAVVVQVDGLTVGYLSRRDAGRLQKRLLALSSPLRVPAKLIGGTGDKPTFGIIVDCRDAERLPKPKLVRKKKLVVDPRDQPF